MPGRQDRRNKIEHSSPPPGNGDIALGLLPTYVGYNLRRAQAASFRHLEHLARDLNLTPGQFSLLSLLAGNPGISQKAVSAVTGVDTSTALTSSFCLALNLEKLLRPTTASRKFTIASLAHVL